MCELLGGQVRICVQSMWQTRGVKGVNFALTLLSVFQTRQLLFLLATCNTLRLIKLRKAIDGKAQRMCQTSESVNSYSRHVDLKRNIPVSVHWPTPST